MNFSLKHIFFGLALSATLAQTGAIGAWAAPQPQVQQPYAGARDIIGEIISVVGLKMRFEVLASAEVDNAAAVILHGKRYILYNPAFLGAVNNAVETDWAGVSILAHEIGHHLNGHTLSGKGSNRADELEADEFSGFVLRKMGASLKDAQAAMALLADTEASDTHPAKAQRLASISTGWKMANTQLLASAAPATRKAPPSAAVPAPAPPKAPAVGTAPVYAQIDARHLVGLVVFDNAPGQKFYITTRLNVLKQGKKGLQVVGQLKETDSARFPFMITSDTYSSLLISDSGIVVNRKGQRVGKLQQVQA